MVVSSHRIRARHRLACVMFLVAVATVLALGLFDTGGLMAATGLPDLVLHAAAFGLLGAIGRPIAPALRLFLFLVALAAGLELAQYFGPWHEASLLDILAGAAGAGFGILVAGVLRRAAPRAVE